MQPALGSPLIGLLLAMGSAMAFGIMAVGVSHLSSDFSSMQLVFGFGTVGSILLAPWAIKSGKQLYSRDSWPLWVRAILGAVAVVMYYVNLGTIPVGHAIALANVAPLLAAVFEVVVLRKSVALMEAAGFVLIVLGLGTLKFRPEQMLPTSALMLGLFGALCAAGSYIALGRAVRTYKFQVVTWVFCFSCLLLSLPVLDSFPTQGPMLPFIGVSALGVIGQNLMGASFRYLRASLASALSLTSMLWAVALGALITSALPPLQTILAYAVVLLGTFLVQQHLRISSKRRQQSVE